jgi:hypothetical protein
MCHLSVVTAATAPTPNQPPSAAKIARTFGFSAATLSLPVRCMTCALSIAALRAATASEPLSAGDPHQRGARGEEKKAISAWSRPSCTVKRRRVQAIGSAASPRLREEVKSWEPGNSRRSRSSCSRSQPSRAGSSARSSRRRSSPHRAGPSTSRDRVDAPRLVEPGSLTRRAVRWELKPVTHSVLKRGSREGRTAWPSKVRHHVRTPCERTDDPRVPARAIRLLSRQEIPQRLAFLQRFRESPLPDSNRRPPPYHGSPSASRAYTRDQAGRISSCKRGCSRFARCVVRCRACRF